MDAAAKRRSEIDAKKAKLAELRRLREARQITLPLADPIPGSASISLSTSRLADRKDIDDLVNSLVGEGSKARDPPRLETVASSKEPSGGSPAKDQDPSEHPAYGTTSRHTDTNQTSKANVTTLDVDKDEASKSASDGHDQTSVISEAKAITTAHKREIITYTKGTQTTTEDPPPTPENKDTTDKESQDELITRLRQQIEAELRLERDEIAKREAQASSDIEQLTTTVEDEVKPASSNGGDASTTIETGDSLGTHNVVDVLPDYTRDVETEQESTEDGKLLQLLQFSNDLTKNRMVTSLSWSPKFPELVLASYTKDQRSANGSGGLVLVWNTKIPIRPEFTLFCQGEVQQAIFSPYHANIIVGGSYSGQIMIWDVKSKNHPVLTTPLSGKGHTYPITGLHMIGTKQSNSIVSASNDGTVCIWSPDILAQPQESFELALLPPSKVEEVTPSAVSHTPADSSTFLVGTEDGNMYSVNRQDRAGAKAGIDPKVVYKGHAAMITGIDHHRCKGLLDLSDLVLTASLDWSIKLWRVRPPPSMAASANGVGGPVVHKYLLDFQVDDMVYDVRWSPARPGVFASVDGTGACQVYDLCHNVEVPVAVGRPTQDDQSTPTGSVSPSLNKVVWDMEGRRLAVGGLDSMVTIFEVPASVSGKEAATNEQWYQLNHKLKVAAKR